MYVQVLTEQEHHLLWPECSLHHLHEVLIRHCDGDVCFATVRTLVQRTTAILQIDG